MKCMKGLRRCISRKVSITLLSWMAKLKCIWTMAARLLWLEVRSLRLRPRLHQGEIEFLTPFRWRYHSKRNVSPMDQTKELDSSQAVGVLSRWRYLPRRFTCTNSSNSWVWDSWHQYGCKGRNLPEVKCSWHWQSLVWIKENLILRIESSVSADYVLWIEIFQYFSMISNCDWAFGQIPKSALMTSGGSIRVIPNYCSHKRHSLCRPPICHWSSNDFLGLHYLFSGHAAVST